MAGEVLLGISDDSHLPEASLAVEAGLAAAFVGTLDNGADLAKELQQREEPPVSMTPAGVLVAAFRAFGEAAPSRLRGAFAAVVTDGRKMWCFRDQIGFQTLFYREDSDGVYVATEVKQVVAGSGVGWEPDLEVLEPLFYADDYDESLCAVRGVRRVVRATLLTADAGQIASRRYWEPEHVLETARISADELIGRFEELMTQAVARVLTGADAIALSGGVDSPAVAAFAAPEHLRLSGRPLSAISAVYPQYPSADERRYIEEVAQALDLPLDTYVPSPQRLDRLQEWVRLFDGPWPIWSPEGAVNRYSEATARGFRTLLTGEVAEELVGGRRYIVSHLIWQGRFRALLRDLALQRAEGTKVVALLREVASSFMPRWLMAARFRSNMRISIPEWMDDARMRARLGREAVPARERWRSQQLGVFTGVGTSAEANSICQAYCGIRVRSPWADVDLWEFFLSLPAELKFPAPRSKALVRSLLRGKVPDVILDRRDKTVMNDWFLAECTDYPSLRRWLTRPQHRIPGVDYELLAQHLEDEDMDLSSYLWAKDLAVVHAFLDLW